MDSRGLYEHGKPLGKFMEKIPSRAVKYEDLACDSGSPCTGSCQRLINDAGKSWIMCLPRSYVIFQ